MLKRDACIEELKENIQDKSRDKDQDKTFEECGSFIKRIIEYWHNQVLNRQRQKFENLEQKKIGHSNQGQNACTDTATNSTTVNGNNNWVINLSNTPLTTHQERLLSWGPKFVIRPKKPPVGEYVAAVEQACTRLNQGEADELHVEVKKTIKKAQNRSTTPSNITKDEFKALKELKER